MKYIKFIFTGVLFGVILYKSQAVSWYRIYEMFRFQSFHMYGIIGSALLVGALLVALIKRTNLKDMNGESIRFTPKNKSITRYLVGGIAFGLGWALVGACPGPMYTLIGSGVWSVLIVLISAVAGTFIYGVLRKKLPH